MPFHVFIDRSRGQPGRIIRFNVTQEWIEERLVGPWDRGEDIVLGGQHWPPRAVRVRVVNGEPHEGPETLDGWNDACRAGADVTDNFLRAPAGNQSVEPVAATADNPRSVMVVHGRDDQARRAMFEFLRSLGLRPLEWATLVGEANVGAPYIGDVLDAAFSNAQAAVVLSTPDDIVRLRPELIPSGDPEDEARPNGQARPNVFIEAGMALGRFPKRTIFAELGHVRPASDLLGRHAVRLDNGPECRQDLAQRLENAGCLVDNAGTDWLTAGDFTARNTIAPDAFAGSEPSPLVARIQTLLDDLPDSQEYVLLGVAQIYNDLIREAGVEGMPAATPMDASRIELASSAPTRSRMTASEMRTHLNQLSSRIGSSAT